MNTIGIFDRFLTKKDNSGKPLSAGKLTKTVQGYKTTLSPYRSRTANVLEGLRKINDEADALQYLRKVNPDVSMAIWNFLRLSNQGHEMDFYGVRGRNKGQRIQRLSDEWREFAARVNAISNAGLDGLIDQLHMSAFMRGAQAVEVEVAETLDDLVDVYPVNPQTVEWSLEERNGRTVWVPYQQQRLGKVDLWCANFFWVPVDPDIDDPRGTLIMSPVLQAIDFQMQILQDLQAVIHNQGWPRYDIELMLERVMKAMPQAYRADPKKQKEWLEERVKEVYDAFKSLEPDDTFIHFDDIKVGKAQGGEVTRSIDVRAISEMLDQQMMSGAKQMGAFMNRTSGTTETWSTVQFRIFVGGIISIQRGSKRLMEEIARLWLRTRGIQATPVFTHHTVDWQSEMDKAQVSLLWEQFWAVAQLMGWVDGSKAAQEVVGTDKAVGSPSEAVKANFSVGGGGIGLRDGPGGLAASVREDDAKGRTEREGRGWLPRIFGGHNSAKGSER